MMEINNRDVTTWALPENAIARLGRGSVKDVAFSPDGMHLAAATDIGLWWYELATMQPVALWETERGMVSAVSFSHDGQWIATGNADGIVKVWTTQDQQCIMEIGQRRLNHGVAQLTFSPDGQYLAASHYHFHSVSVWSTKTGVSVANSELEEPKARYGRFPLCFSPDGTRLAYLSCDNKISVKQIETGAYIARFTVHTPRIDGSLIFSPCGQFLAAGIRKKDSENLSANIHVWHVPKETVEMATEYNGYQVRLVYSPEGSLRVADIHEDKVIIWNASDQEKLDTFEHRGNSRAAGFSDDGQQFAITSPRDFQVWRENAPQVVSLQGHRGHPNSVTFTQNGKTLVSGHTAGSGIVFWNVAEKRAQQTLLMNTALPFTIPKGGLAVSPDEEFLAASYTKTIEVWRVASRTRIMIFTEPQSVGPLAFSPTGKHFVSATSDGGLYVWDAQRWKKLRTLTGHTDGISSIAFHPDGKILASVSPWDKTARVWDVARGSFVTSLPLAWPLSPNAYKGDKKKIERVRKAAVSNSQKVRAEEIWNITFSACGTLLAGGLPNEIRVWDTTTYETRMVIFPPKESCRPYALAFSPCSRYFVSGSWWGFTDKVSIRLWDVTTGENVQTFWGHSTDVQDLAFSPDGALLASAGYDGAILLWDMKPYTK
ncbi:hypothetical protein C6503_16260 [Candidatus Poribacteria bacterium]|nr:MAG: hypothetical protein C6503_16260 [Candidatus Poribacteria bacterium]